MKIDSKRETKFQKSVFKLSDQEDCYFCKKEAVSSVKKKKEFTTIWLHSVYSKMYFTITSFNMLQNYKMYIIRRIIISFYDILSLFVVIMKKLVMDNSVHIKLTLGIGGVKYFEH